MKKGIFFKVLLVGVLLLGLSRLVPSQGGRLEYLFSYGLYPFIEVQRVVVNRIGRWKQEREAYTTLVQKLAHEQSRCQDLQKDLIEARSSQYHCKNTADLREFIERYSLKDAHNASILFKHFDRSHFYIVDKGARAGIKKNMIAVYKSCLVGRVVAVYPLYSRIMLITDPLCKVAAFCSATGAKGIYEGTGHLQNAVLGYIDPLEEVKIAGLVLSSGQGLIFPQGFGLGKIMNAAHEGSRYVVQVQLLLDYSMLDYCTLISQDSSLIDSISLTA